MTRPGHGQRSALVRKAGLRARVKSALPRLIAPHRLIDNVESALAAHNLVVAMARAERFERILDLHSQYL